MLRRIRSLALLLSAVLALNAIAAPAAADGAAAQPPHEAPGRPAATLGAAAVCPDPTTIPRTVAPADTVTLPILLYHHVRRLPANASAVWRNLTVTPEAFEAQVKYLVDQGYHTIYFSDLIAYFNAGVPLPARPIILTFDDGWIEQYTVVYPILQKYCLTATFFPPVNWVNNGGGKQVISWAMIEEMSRGGMEFGSHTLNHHLLNQQTENQIMEQLVGSKAELEKHTIRPVVALAYPGGGYNKSALALAPKAGYGAAVGITAGPDQARSDLFLLRRSTVPYSDDLKAFAARLQSRRPPAAASQPVAPPLPRSMAWADRWAGLADR